MRNGESGSLVIPIPIFVAPPDAPTPVAPGIYTRVTTLVKQIKLHSEYTEAIGKDLEIIGA